MYRIKLAAFTLAEVLITLTIIGIVAAMTIPTLIGKYKDQVTITKLKKAQSVLANAFAIQKTQSDSIVEVYRYNDTPTTQAELIRWSLKDELVAPEMNKYIKGKLNNHQYTREIISDDGLIYGFHEPYQIYVITDKKEANRVASNGYHQVSGYIYGFSYNPEIGLMPLGAPSSSTRLSKETVCPDAWQGSPCTFWTLQTGKVKKKAGEWDDSLPSMGYHNY